MRSALQYKLAVRSFVGGTSGTARGDTASRRDRIAVGVAAGTGAALAHAMPLAAAAVPAAVAGRGALVQDGWDAVLLACVRAVSVDMARVPATAALFVRGAHGAAAVTAAASHVAVAGAAAWSVPLGMGVAVAVAGLNVVLISRRLVKEEA